MASPQPSQVAGLPGFYWYYKPDHGYRGRHAYNPTTGVALPYRQVLNVRSGKLTEQQAIDRLAKPLSTKSTRNYRVSTFSSLYGAFAYASSHTGNPSYILVHGTPYTLYQGEPTLTYRSLFGMTDASRHKSKGIFAYYHELDRLMNPSGNRGFVVWERH